MPLTWSDIRQRALSFQNEWTGVPSRRGEAKSFWNAFFDVFGVSRRRVASFEAPVKLREGRRGNVDILIPSQWGRDNSIRS